MKARRLILLCALLAAAPARAEEIEDLSLEALLGTVTAASRTEESLLKAPLAVTVLDQDDIRRSGAMNLPDLLRMVPGAQVTRTGPGNYSVSLRGTGSVHSSSLMVLVDGVPVTSKLDATVDWSNLPVDLANVERVEIVRGPASTIYGANAFAGVIDIISAQPVGGGARGAARLAIGVDDTGGPIGVLSGRVGGTRGPFTWRLAGHATVDSTATGTPGFSPEGLMAAGVSARLQANLGRRQTLSLDLGLSHRGRVDADGVVPQREQVRGGLATASLRYQLRPAGGALREAAVWARGRFQYSRAVTSDLTTNPFGYRDLRTMDGDAGADLHLRLPHHLSASLGGSVGVVWLDAGYVHPLENRRARGQYGGYASGAADLWGRLQLSVGARVDASARTDGLRLSLRASAIYYRPSYSLRLSIGRAFREPSYVEIAGQLVDHQTGLVALEGDPAAAPPTNTYAELGAIIAPSPRLTVMAAVYVQYLTNGIDLKTTSVVRRRFTQEPDRDDQVMAGGEAEARWRVNPHLTLAMNLAVIGWIVAAPEMIGIIANEDNNSAVLGWAGARTTWLDGRVAASLGLGYASPRSYHAVAGIPPVRLDLDVPHQVRLEAAGDYRPVASVPVRAFFKLQTSLPHRLTESPVPGAGPLGTVVILGAEYHAE